MSTLVCQTVSANSDVLGKGIRINFYYTIFLLSVIPQTPITMELLNSLYITASTWGFGLLLTAIIQTAQHQLSLFHAIFILHMLSFLGFGVAPLGRYHLTGTRIAMASLIQSVTLVSYVSWGLYLWVNVKHYGSQPECNHQIKYVVFFFTVRATANWLRRLSIAVLASLCPAILFNVLGTLATIFFAIMNRTNEEEEVEETDSLSYAGDYFSVDTSRLFSAIYSTVMLELTIARNTAHILPNGTNTGPGVVQVDDSWGFGQVLSVVMIFINFKEVLHYIFRVYMLVYEE